MDVEDLWARTIETARASGVVEPGDLVVLVAGTAVNLSGSTNVIKVDVAWSRRPRGRRSGRPRRERPCMRLRPTRLLALGAIVRAGLLYWKPLHTYMHTREELDRRQAEVAKLQQQQAAARAADRAVGSGHVLVREARRLGLVKPGEQLYIVRGIPAWRQKH